ncbi:hypothetical cytosolic protein [Syntrophus aciditrophicus SB]|uniref:Hypothetical cytosolic protein n=1 Tax=Syntrophus aciditrophicus (strain SB) TaxID=56780 RepID=Q2LPX9_SYNAS|nr:hypothetical cytosolic protein [Syntrophus aciditrophicus SB]
MQTEKPARDRFCARRNLFLACNIEVAFRGFQSIMVLPVPSGSLKGMESREKKFHEPFRRKRTSHSSYPGRHPDF